MAKLSLKIGLSIIIAGLFVMLSLIAINYSHAGYLFYLILFLLAVFVFLFGFAAGEKLSLPLKKILTKANQLLGGDLSSRFYSDSKDELGQLGNAFNKIADQLQEQSAENERIKKSLGIKVEVETQALQETISALEQKVQNRSMELHQ